MSSENSMEERLIEEVKRRKLLYDTSNKNYLNQAAKLSAWNEIAVAVGEDGNYISVLYSLNIFQCIFAQVVMHGTWKTSKCLRFQVVCNKLYLA